MPQPERPEVTRVSTSFGIDSIQDTDATQRGQTAPYMHDGSMATLAEVLDYYDRGGETNTWLDEKMRPLDLTDQEKEDLLAFLESLTGEVPEWALRAPLLPPEESEG